MRFWDTSAIIPLCVDEPQTSGMRSLRDEDPTICMWWATRVECHAALARRAREGLGAESEVIARISLLDLFQEVDEVAPTEDLRRQAERLLLVHPLRAADALQLAAAVMWARDRPLGMGFVCLDRRLRDAARREGFEVLPASLE